VTDACPKVTRERLANRRAHTLLNIEAGGFRYVAGVGHYQDGRLAEIFLTAAKGGTAIDDADRDSAVVATSPCSTASMPTRSDTLSCVMAMRGVRAARHAARPPRKRSRVTMRTQWAWQGCRKSVTQPFTSPRSMENNSGSRS
jgi:hypothetical protein